MYLFCKTQSTFSVQKFPFTQMYSSGKLLYVVVSQQNLLNKYFYVFFFSNLWY